MEDSKQDKSAKVSILKRPIVWVYLSVIYIWVIAISVLIATLGPPYVLSLVVHPKNLSSFSYFIESFPLYVQEATKELNISANIFMYSFFSNIIVFPIAISIGFFVLKTKKENMGQKLYDFYNPSFNFAANNCWSYNRGITY